MDRFNLIQNPYTETQRANVVLFINSMFHDLFNSLSRIETDPQFKDPFERLEKKSEKGYKTERISDGT